MVTATARRLAARLNELRDRDLGPEAYIAEAGGALREAIPFDAWCLFTTDPETNLPTGGVVEGFPSWTCVPFWDNELLDPDFNKFNVLARSTDPVATLSDVTDGEVSRSPRHQRINARMEMVDELRAAFPASGSCWGFLHLVRGELAGGFRPDEVGTIEDLVPQLACGLRRAVIATSTLGSESEPAVLIVDTDGRLEQVTAGAQQWLEELATDGGTLGMPTVVTIAAARARRGSTTTRATMRSRGRSGRWFVVDATPFDNQPGGSVAVTLRPAHPSELLPILLEAYELTPRETDVVVRIARGLATKQIAAELCISVHTVRDHVKVIFDKVEVNSRGELVAKLFSEHFLGRFYSNVLHSG
jgi:DNA-binding CsgD family transcriptional regulator